MRPGAGVVREPGEDPRARAARRAAGHRRRGAAGRRRRPTRVADQLATLAGLPVDRLPAARPAGGGLRRARRPAGARATAPDDFFRDRADDAGRRLRLLTIRDTDAGGARRRGGAGAAVGRRGDGARRCAPPRRTTCRSAGWPSTASPPGSPGCRGWPGSWRSPTSPPSTWRWRWTTRGHSAHDDADHPVDRAGHGRRRRPRAAGTAAPRRSSPRCWPTSASRSRSSSPSWSPAPPRCSPRRSTRSPTPATRCCCWSAAAGPSARRRPSTRSASAATATSTPSSSRSCCSASVACSPSTRACTSSSTPRQLESPAWAIGVLVVAIVLEGFSLRTAIKETDEVKSPQESYWRFIRHARAPELPVVLLEDTAALARSASSRCSASGWPRSPATASTTASARSRSACCCVVVAVILGDRDQEPAAGRVRDPGGPAQDRRRAARAAVAGVGHPHADAAPGPRRGARRGQDRRAARRHGGGDRRRTSTTPSAGSATPSRSPGSSTSSPTSAGAGPPSRSARDARGLRDAGAGRGRRVARRLRAGGGTVEGMSRTLLSPARRRADRAAARGRGRRRPRHRRRRHRRRRRPGRGQPRAVGGAARGARLRGRHLQPVEQADPRRPALPGAVRLPAGARGAVGAVPAGADHRAAPGDPAAVPAAAHRAGVAARLLRRRRRALRRARRRLHQRAGDPAPPAPVPHGHARGVPRAARRRRPRARSATGTRRSTTPGTRWPSSAPPPATARGCCPAPG